MVHDSCLKVVETLGLGIMGFGIEMRMSFSPGTLALSAQASAFSGMVSTVSAAFKSLSFVLSTPNGQLPTTLSSQSV